MFINTEFLNHPDLDFDRSPFLNLSNYHLNELRHNSEVNGPAINIFEAVDSGEAYVLETPEEIERTIRSSIFWAICWEERPDPHGNRDRHLRRLLRAIYRWIHNEFR